MKSRALEGSVHVFLETHSDFLLPSHLSTRGVVSICPFPLRPRGLKDVAWLGGERAVPQPTSVPLAVTPASSNAMWFALP